MQVLFQKSAQAEIKKIEQKLINLDCQISELTTKAFNYEMIVNKNKESIKVLVYFGKKGVKTVLQGNKESLLYKQINKLLFGEELFIENNSIEMQNFDEYIGTDESGKGDYFGPLVTAAVYTNKQISFELEQIGVKDSKLISDNEIKKIETDVKKIIKSKFEIILINPEKYNLLFEQFKNLNKILAWAHTKAIQNLIESVNCNNVISDKFGSERLIKSELAKKNIDINIFQTTKGERFTGVAAASILARAKVIDWFKNKSKEIGLEIPKGAGEQVNLIAQKILQKTDKEYLSKMIKFHFKNSQKIFIK